MTIDDIERLVRRLEGGDVTAFAISSAALSLSLRFAPGAAAPERDEVRSSAVPAGAVPCAPAEPRAIRAPAIGLLRLRHPAAAPVTDNAGPRQVASGEIVAFLEAGGCLRPVVAEADGRIGAPLRPDGSLVGYGTPLFPIL